MYRPLYPLKKNKYYFCRPQTKTQQKMITKSPFRILPIFLFLFITSNVIGQLSLDYAFSLGSPVSDFFGSFKVDPAGNYYMLGEYVESADMDPGPGQDLVGLDSTSALVLSKFGADGQYIQSSVFYSDQNIGGTIEELKNNQLLLVLYFTDSLMYIFQGDTSELYKAPGRHISILRMSLEGAVISQYTFKASETFYLAKLILLSDQSYIVAGSFQDSISFTSGGPQYISNGDYDGFIAKLSPFLTLEWYHPFSSAQEEYIEDIFVKDEQKIYFAVTHADTLVVETAEGTKTFPSNGEDNNIFGVMSMDGEVEKAFPFGGDLGDQVRTIVSDAAGNIYISGYFEGSVNFENPNGIPQWHTSINESDGFVSKYTADGSLVWTRIIADSEYGGIYTMNLERGNELYLSGSFSETADLDPGPDSNIVTTSYRGDIFILKLNTAGETKWVYTFPGNDFEGIRNVVLSNLGKVYVSGYYFDSIDCDFTDDQLFFQSQGGSDVFLMAFSEEGITINTKDISAFETFIKPNPASDKIYITSEYSIDHLSIYSLDGSQLNLPMILDGKTASLNLTGISAGMYFVRTASGDRISISKIIKQ